MDKRVLMPVDDNRGYAPHQIETDFTLGDLLEHVENAIEDHGADAVIVLSNGQRYGAGYGRIGATRYGDLFQLEDEEDEL